MYKFSGDKGYMGEKGNLVSLFSVYTKKKY